MAFATVLAYLALIGAVASWIAGAWFYLRTLRSIPARDGRLKWLAIVAWPFAVKRLEGAAAEHASRVNKALVAFMACILVGVAAFSVSTNLHRFAK
jgi:hypothetical protein